MNRQSTKITALYCRVDGGNHMPDAFDAIRRQQENLIRYAQANGLKNPCIYADCGFSGTTLNRPEFQRMLREVKAGNVAAIVVTDLSRLTRSYTDCGNLMDVTLPRHGVTLHTTREGVYDPAPYRQLKTAILSMLKGGGA